MKLAAFPKCFMDDLCIHRTMTVYDWIGLAGRELRPLGVTGLEMYGGYFTDTSTASLRSVRDSALDSGFSIPMLCVSPDFTNPDPAERRREIEAERAWIDAAATLGCSTCRVLSGQRRPDVTREQGVNWVVECIQELLPHAAGCGVTLAMENHFKDNYWQYPEFAQKMDIFCEIAGRITEPAFGVNYDPSNTLLAGEDALELLRRTASRVVSMHASDRRPKPGVELSDAITDYSQLIHGEIGTGVIDFDAIFSILAGAGFNGWVSIEDGVTGIEELKRSAVYLAAKLAHWFPEAA